MLPVLCQHGAVSRGVTVLFSKHNSAYSTGSRWQQQGACWALSQSYSTVRRQCRSTALHVSSHHQSRTLKSQQTCRSISSISSSLCLFVFTVGVFRDTQPAHSCSKNIPISTERLWGKHRELSDIAAGPLVTPSGRGGTKCCVSEQLAAGRSPFCSSGQKC